MLTVKREVVWSGDAIVSIAVPHDAEWGRAPQTPEGDLRYVKFAQMVQGGAVHLFVHHPNPGRFRGGRITASVEVVEKTLADGRRYLHVNLFPKKEGARATHRLAVMTRAREVVRQDGFIIQDTPWPLQGAIVIAPLGAKIHLRS
ncbi:hypothetical protein HYV30_00845 [Candidatus Kaiserbacteria bacterium]|nr:hypothetical protein [Candidatus Kaiserbacteria bacterium]